MSAAAPGADPTSAAPGVGLMSADPPGAALMGAAVMGAAVMGAGPGCVGPPPWFATTFPQVQPQITVTISLQTLLGLNDDPGMLDQYGPVAAELARDLAVNGIWRCLAVDDTHATVQGVARSTYTPAYTPGAALTAFLDSAAPTCTVPTCTIRAWRCDLDHRIPHPTGATCDCNVRPLCRRHHRLKTAGLLTITPSTNPHHPPGTWTYTTRAGRAHPAMPHTPLPRDGLPPTDASAPRGATGPPGTPTPTPPDHPPRPPGPPHLDDPPPF